MRYNDGTVDGLVAANVAASSNVIDPANPSITHAITVHRER